MESGEVSTTVTTFPRQPRRGGRDRVIRRVQLLVDGRAVDAVMLDVSTDGARVQVGVADDMPDEFLLRAADGGVRRVARRWTQDGQFGLEFIGEALVENTAPRIRTDRGTVVDLLREGPVRDALQVLGQERHFDDETLRVAARDLAAALDRVERALTDAPRLTSQD